MVSTEWWVWVLSTVVGVGGEYRVVGVGGEYRVVGVGGGCRVVVVGGGCRVVGGGCTGYSQLCVHHAATQH